MKTPHALPVDGKNIVDAPTAGRMVEEMTDPAKARMPELLNRAEALLECKAGTIGELGAFLLPEKPKPTQYNRTHEWIKQRLYPISQGEVAVRLLEWIEAREKSIRAKAGGRKLYAEALQSIESTRQ